MNFAHAYQEALPLALPTSTADCPGADASDLQLADAAMLAFNHQLHDVHGHAPSVAANQVHRLAHWLRGLPPETAQATINLRLARAESLRRMLDDADWNLPNDIAQRGRRLLGYLCRIDDLIPDDVPLVGHLDDALMVELCWSEFAGEVQDYIDYCRFCSEQPVRGSVAERRSGWESDCLVRASTLLHRQAVRERGYSRPLPLPRRFRVC